MAGRGGRGGGRGRGMSFSVEALGFSRGEALPPPILQPPPLFPPLESKPVPLLNGEVEDYILALKQELRGTFQSSNFYLQPTSKKRDVERYSDRYQQRSLSNNKVPFDWTRLPKELHPPQLKRKSPAADGATSSKRKKLKKKVDIGKTLENLEAVEKNSSEEEEQKEVKKEEEDEEEPEEEIEEEELEEETDYAFNYFDNGEDYADEEDDNLDDGPTY